jgi:hypothetical protein
VELGGFEPSTKKSEGKIVQKFCLSYTVAH